MAGSEATLGQTLGRRDRQPPCHSVIQQLSATMKLTTSLLGMTLQLNLTTYKPRPGYCIIIPLIQQSIMLQYSQKQRTTLLYRY